MMRLKLWAVLLLQEIGLVSDLQGQVIDLENWEFTIVEAECTFYSSDSSRS